MEQTDKTTSEKPKAADSNQQIELLSFIVGTHEYSVDIMKVREIRGWTETTSLPHAPPFVRGVINLRGTVLPVIDLALRLGLQADPPSERNVVIVVDVSDSPVGLRVDAVSDILTVSENDLMPPPTFSEDQSGTFLTAVTLVNDKMIRVLDLVQTLPGNVEIAA